MGLEEHRETAPRTVGVLVVTVSDTRTRNGDDGGNLVCQYLEVDNSDWRDGRASVGIQARDRLQQAAGHPSGNPGAEALVTDIADRALSSDWSELIGLANRIAAMNDRNGRLAADVHRDHGHERSGENVDEIIAEENQAYDAIRPLQHSFGDPRTAVSLARLVAQLVAVDAHEGGFRS